MKTLTIEVKFGGLGDHLFYSHIPRIAKESGLYDKVYISNKSPFRSPEYKTLIWELNPYVDGFSDENGKWTKNIIPKKGENILDVVMLEMGLDDGKRFHEPEIYFKPKKDNPKTFGKTLYDPNYVSFVGFFDGKDLERELKKRNTKINCIMKKRNKSMYLPEIKDIQESSSLTDFCEMIVSCRELHCLTSGTATLASALGKPATVYYGIWQDTMFHHSKLHDYIFIQERLSEEIWRRLKSKTKYLFDKIIKRK
ncbi:MAG: hypothetical protein WCK48_02980 [bacterium]